MDGNYLRNLLGSAVLGAIRGARNEEQGSSVSVPILTRELSVPQIQDLSSISIQQEHRKHFLRPARSQLLKTGSVLFQNVYPVHLAKSSVH